MASPLPHNEVLITQVIISDPTWPTDLVLDLEKSNWHAWNHQIRLLADKFGVRGWLMGTLSCPDTTANLRAHHIWETTDLSLCAFILQHIAPLEFDEVKNLATSHAVFEHLHGRHEKLGLYAQLMYLKEGLDVMFEPNAPFVPTLGVIKDIHRSLSNIGEINLDKIHAVLIINTLSMHYLHLQSTIQEMTESPSFLTSILIRRLLNKDQLSHTQSCCTANNVGATALAVIRDRPPGSSVFCTNCKKSTHTIDFCVKAGGKMAGRTIEEAWAAQRAASGHPPHMNTNTRSQGSQIAPISNVPASATPHQITINGVTYLPQSQAPSVATANVATALSKSPSPAMDPSQNDPPCIEYTAFLLDHTTSVYASMDWNSHTQVVDHPTPVCAAVTPLGHCCPTKDTCPFIFDTGAMCHISPEHSDFMCLWSIPPYPIKGVGGSCVHAVGMGNIELTIAKGCKMVL
jgi:gag-polypeptide of LTR copia-type